MKKVRILGIGVATLDIYVNQGRMYPGGNEYNVCLLYTSPSPRDSRSSRMPSSA